MARAINPNQLQAALLQLDASKLPQRQKRALKRLALTQANPDAQQPDVVVKSMRKGRRTQVLSATKAVTEVLSSVNQRGAALLGVMTDEEWNRLSVRG